MKILNEVTKKYLKLNKKRTIVTLIGIILSGAMISAVTTLAVTFQRFMLDVEITQSGEWESIIENVSIEELQKIKENKQIKEVLVMEPISIAKNQYSEDEFIMLYKYDEKALTKMNGELLEGRMPQNENEIVLSTSFFDGKENEPKIGDKVTFILGKRMDEGYELTYQAKSEIEEFIEDKQVTYTVCGKMYRPVFESYRDNYTSGITLLVGDINSNNIDVGLIHKNAKDVYKNTEEIYENLDKNEIHKMSYNTYVLAYKGVNKDDSFNKMLYSICAILIAVIMVGSILVIYNSFAISVSERKKQFGMISSIGATKKQIKKSVIYEAGVLGIIGIPIGMICGIAGIGITLKIVNNLLAPILQEGNWNFKLIISWEAILIAIIFIGITIYLSVIIPARRASRISPIEAIRQVEDIKVKPKKLKTPKFIRKIFGVQGELALKNLKRSKKRYRTTVISLIISIVLFMVTSGFVGYMFEGFDTIYKTVDYDYEIILKQKENTEEVFEKISNIDKIEKIVKYQYINKVIEIPVDKLNKKLKETLNENRKENGMEELENEFTNYQMVAKIYCLDEKTYNDYLKQLGIKNLQEDEYILVNYANLLQQYKIETELLNYKQNDEIEIIDYDYQYNEKTKEETKTPINSYKIKFAKITDKLPYGIDEIDYFGSIILITSKDNFNKIPSKESESDELRHEIVRIKTQDIEILKSSLEGLKDDIDSVYNIKEQIEQMKNLKLIIEIFLYGFILLISAIGISNVFNTISTNIALRRREFANLKSIGMTNKQFKQMLDLECIFYGTKALLYGIPIGTVLCYLLNLAFGNMLEFIFRVPWNSIIISIIAVYAVVYITMIYSSRKVKEENIIDVIRDDNI